MKVKKTDLNKINKLPSRNRTVHPTSVKYKFFSLSQNIY